MSAEGKIDCTVPTGVTPLVVVAKVGSSEWAGANARQIATELRLSGHRLLHLEIAEDEMAMTNWLVPLVTAKPQAMVIVSEESGQSTAFRLGYAYNMMFHESPGILLMPQELEVAKKVFSSRPGIDLAMASGDAAALVELTVSVVTRHQETWQGIPHLPNLLWRKNGNVMTMGVG